MLTPIWIPVSLHITGYADSFYELHKYLQRHPLVGNRIQVQGVEDTDFTGNFEVFVNGILVHSKRTRGQGQASSIAERERIVAAISRYLQEAYANGE